MDNNFENNTGNQPQRPFTEKPEQPQQSFEFNPEKPLMQQPENQAEENSEQSFDPIKQTAVYQDGAFNQAPPQQYAQPFQPSVQGYGAQPPVNPAQNNYPPRGYYNNAYPQNPQGFAQPPVRPPVQPPVQQPVQQPVQPPAGQSAPQQQFVSPLQNPEPPQPDFSGNPYQRANNIPPAGMQQPFVAPQKEKPKSNKGLVAVIIILAVLLAASFTGIIIYAFNNSAMNSSGNSSGNGSNSNGFKLPEYQIPGADQPATEAPTVEESDYSDKTQKDYKGLELNKIPDDAKTNNAYGSDYAFKKASPSVVGIKGFSDKDKKTKASEGSGIIISEDGYVITNAHVVLNSKTAMLISVYTSDGKEFNAGVVGFDSRTDIALLKLDDAKGLVPAQFGDSNQLAQGDDLVVVGNPGGMEFQNSMTKGIVSALERDASKKSIVKYIQTDAAINPGNSGGPAVNMYGQVIGIATLKIVDESYEGMGFCIPSATVKTIVDDLMKNGYVANRVKIGISGMAMTSAEAEQLGMSGGIIVQDVDPDGPCGKSGLASGDIIFEADGEKINSFSDIYNVLEKHEEGDKIKLKYYHLGSMSGSPEEKEIEIELQADKG